MRSVSSLLPKWFSARFSALLTRGAVSKRPLLAALIAAPLLGTSLSGCGFQLRGYDTPLQIANTNTVLIIDDDRATFLLKRPLIKRLQALGTNVVDALSLLEDGKEDVLKSGQYNSAIKVSNVRFKKYELVGVLTEIRQVISADVTYQIRHSNGEITQVKNPIQVERSYQYNAASVSTQDQQGVQIQEWLYESLARRITDQYIALNMPGSAATSTLIKQPADKTPAQ